MKRNILWGIFLGLAVLGGLMLSGCEEIEAGIGTIKLLNKSSNVTINYWAIESGTTIKWETHSYIFAGSSASHEIDTGFYSIYLEDTDGDGWVTKTTHTVKKDKTVEVKFPGDFKVSN